MWIQHLRFTPHRSMAAGHRAALGLAVVGVLMVTMAPAAQTADAGGEAPASPTGFSIETEMFTYRALQANTQAIACDVASYINDAEVKSHMTATGRICDVAPSTQSPTVVLMPFGSSELQDFQIWRADMATMARLHRRSVDACPSAESSSRGATGASTGDSGAAPAPKSVLGTLLSASPPLAVAQSILSAMATNAVATSVGGTIKDQAFMNGVARELHRLQVPVLIPTAYGPDSLMPLDKMASPFLFWLDRTLDDRTNCVHDALAAATPAGKPTKTQKGAAGSGSEGGLASPNRALDSVSEIDAFLSTLTGEPLAAPKESGPASTPAVSTAASAGKGGTPAPSAPAVPAAPSGSHLAAVLMADGLAARLGVEPRTGEFKSGGASQVHVLLIQALESGGSVTRSGNFFHSKITYTGGSVGTYALFSLEGDVECSGNVYEYGGSDGAKDFESALAGPVPDPTQQLTLLRGSCGPASASRQ